MFARLASLVRPLDTSEVDAAIADARCRQHQVRVRARALRMDISCGDPGGAIDNLVGRVSASAGFPWWRTLSDARQRVLLNMCFNMGIGRRATAALPAKGLLSFEGGTMRAVKEHRYDDAAKGMLASKWAGQVGARAGRLAAMMRAG